MKNSVFFCLLSILLGSAPALQCSEAIERLAASLAAIGAAAPKTLHIAPGRINESPQKTKTPIIEPKPIEESLVKELQGIKTIDDWLKLFGDEDTAQKLREAIMGEIKRKGVSNTAPLLRATMEAIDTILQNTLKNAPIPSFDIPGDVVSQADAKQILEKFQDYLENFYVNTFGKIFDVIVIGDNLEAAIKKSSLWLIISSTLDALDTTEAEKFYDQKIKVNFLEKHADKVLKKLAEALQKPGIASLLDYLAIKSYKIDPFLAGISTSTKKKFNDLITTIIEESTRTKREIDSIDTIEKWLKFFGNDVAATLNKILKADPSYQKAILTAFADTIERVMRDRLKKMDLGTAGKTSISADDMVAILEKFKKTLENAYQDIAQDIFNIPGKIEDYGDSANLMIAIGGSGIATILRKNDLIAQIPRYKELMILYGQAILHQLELASKKLKLQQKSPALTKKCAEIKKFLYNIDALTLPGEFQKIADAMLAYNITPGDINKINTMDAWSKLFDTGESSWQFYPVDATKSIGEAIEANPSSAKPLVDACIQAVQRILRGALKKTLPIFDPPQSQITPKEAVKILQNFDTQLTHFYAETIGILLNIRYLKKGYRYLSNLATDVTGSKLLQFLQKYNPDASEILGISSDFIRVHAQEMLEKLEPALRKIEWKGDLDDLNDEIESVHELLGRIDSDTAEEFKNFVDSIRPLKPFDPSSLSDDERKIYNALEGLKQFARKYKITEAEIAKTPNYQQYRRWPATAYNDTLAIYKKTYLALKSILEESNPIKKDEEQSLNDSYDILKNIPEKYKSLEKIIENIKGLTLKLPSPSELEEMPLKQLDAQYRHSKETLEKALSSLEKRKKELEMEITDLRKITTLEGLDKTIETISSKYSISLANEKTSLDKAIENRAQIKAIENIIEKIKAFIENKNNNMKEFYDIITEIQDKYSKDFTPLAKEEITKLIKSKNKDIPDERAFIKANTPRILGDLGSLMHEIENSLKTIKREISEALIEAIDHVDEDIKPLTIKMKVGPPWAEITYRVLSLKPIDIIHNGIKNFQGAPKPRTQEQQKEDTPPPPSNTTPPSDID